MALSWRTGCWAAWVVAMRLVALVPNLLARGGRRLLEAARRLDGRRAGSCVFLEADMDALALIDEAERLGAEELVLVGMDEEAGERVTVETVEPRRVDPEREAQRIVKDLWMNLTGSLGLGDYVEALRILYPRRFTVVRCGGEACGEPLLGKLRELCGGLPA